MEDGQNPALDTDILPYEAAMVEAIDKRLEAEIAELRGLNITIKQVKMGRGIYFLFAKYGVRDKVHSAPKLAGIEIHIFPNLFKRARVWLTLSKRQVLFERVGDKRYPILIDLDSNSPTSVTLVG